MVPVSVRRRADRAILPIPIPSFPFQRANLLSGDLHKTTLTDLKRHVRGVCTPPHGNVNVASIAMFATSRYVATCVPLFVNL